MMKFFLKTDEKINLVDLIDKKLYIADLRAHTSSGAINTMAASREEFMSIIKPAYKTNRGPAK